jgi:hypothetical protein
MSFNSASIVCGTRVENSFTISSRVKFLCLYLTIVVNTDSCDREGTHWVAFHFPKEGPAEFFDSFRRAPDTYHCRFRNVLIANGPQYNFNTVRVQHEDGDTPIVFSLASLGGRFVDGTSTYQVIYQTPRVSEYECGGSTG